MLTAGSVAAAADLEGTGVSANDDAVSIDLYGDIAGYSSSSACLKVADADLSRAVVELHRCRYGFSETCLTGSFSLVVVDVNCSSQTGLSYINDIPCM